MGALRAEDPWWQTRYIKNDTVSSGWSFIDCPRCRAPPSSPSFVFSCGRGESFAAVFLWSFRDDNDVTQHPFRHRGQRCLAFAALHPEWVALIGSDLFIIIVVHPYTIRAFFVFGFGFLFSACHVATGNATEGVAAPRKILFCMFFCSCFSASILSPWCGGGECGRKDSGNGTIPMMRIHTYCSVVMVPLSASTPKGLTTRVKSRAPGDRPRRSLSQCN